MSYLIIPSLGNKLGHTLMHENWQAIVQADATLLSYMRWTPTKEIHRHLHVLRYAKEVNCSELTEG